MLESLLFVRFSKPGDANSFAAVRRCSGVATSYRLVVTEVGKRLGTFAVVIFTFTLSLAYNRHQRSCARIMSEVSFALDFIKLEGFTRASPVVLVWRTAHAPEHR